MVRTLITSEEALRKPCQKVTAKRGREVVKELFKFVDLWNKTHIGVREAAGLSAPQIGIDATVCVINTGKLRLALINPVIVDASGVMVQYEEGCLSFPGRKVRTQRHLWIKVYSDNLPERIFGVDTTCVSGKPYDEALFEAVCCQHECAHLSGLLIFDFEKDAPHPSTWPKLK
jgi:peptide deformylase